MRHSYTFEYIPPWDAGNAVDSGEIVVAPHNWDETRLILWNYVGIVISNKRHSRAKRRIEILQDETKEYYWDFYIQATKGTGEASPHCCWLNLSMKAIFFFTALLIILVAGIAYILLGPQSTREKKVIESSSLTKTSDKKRTDPGAKNNGSGTNSVDRKRKSHQINIGNHTVKDLVLDGNTGWVGTTGGVVRFDLNSGKSTIFDNKSGLLSNGVSFVDKIDGKIWVGTYGGGFSIFDGNKWKNYNVPNGLADAFVYDIVKMKDGSLWIATWSGANHVVGDLDDLDSWEIYTVENTKGGLPDNWVYGLVKDKRDDTIWMATEGGLAHFDGKKWENWNHEDGQGAPYELIKSEIDPKMDPSKKSEHHANTSVAMGMGNLSEIYYNPNYIVSLDMDSDGKLWIGTWGGGLSVMENRKYIKTYTTHDGLPGNYIYLAKEGPHGNIWIGTNKGLSKFNGKVFKNYTVNDGLVNNNVFSIAFDKEASIWIGSYKGLAYIKGGLQ